MNASTIKWVLCCIDGTDSKNWVNAKKGNSHTLRFKQNFGKGLSSSDYYKFYLNGPADIYAASDAPSIKAVGLITILSKLTALFYENPSRMKDHNYCRVVLIGHSRGGAIAIDIAKELKNSGIQVFFMGLFDAVDRSTYIEAGSVENVKHAYHALRGLPDSRPIFGNTGIKGTIWKKFQTSHGGVGGDVVFDPQKASKGDSSCSLKPKVKKRGVQFALTITGVVTTKVYVLYESKQEALDRVNKCLAASNNSYLWIEGKAKFHGLPI